MLICQLTDLHVCAVGVSCNRVSDTNMFAVTGQYPGYPQWTTIAQFIKSNGGTSVACLGYNVTSSLAGADGCAKAAKAVGIKAGYLNDSIAFGTVAVSPIALAMAVLSESAIRLAHARLSQFAPPSPCLEG